MLRLVRQPWVHALGRSPHPSFAHDTLRVDRADLMRWPWDAGEQRRAGARQAGDDFTSGGNTIIRGSVDADSTPEFEIQLTGLKTLSATDFML